MSSLHDKAEELREKKKIDERNQDKPIYSLVEADSIIKETIIETFPDETGEAWAYYQDGKKKRMESIEGEDFKDYVRVTINERAKQPREAWVEPIVKDIASKGRRGIKRKLHLRQASQPEGLYYQISKEQAVFISSQEVIVIDSPPIFRNFNHQALLAVDPNAAISDINLLDKYIHFAGKEERELFKDIISAYFIPSIAKPIQLFRGPPGSAKSTVCRVIKMLIDPSMSMEMGIPFPEDNKDWQVNGRQHLVILLDNLSNLTKEQQDTCCRVVTGMDVEERKLYTNNDSVNGRIKAILVINAIELTGLNSDFLDRSFIWELQRITDEQRIPEEDFYRALEADLSKIRGAIFKIIQQAMIVIKTVEAPDLRLKDFAKWAAACAQARGTNPEEFKTQLRIKTELQADESIAQSMLTAPLAAFMETQDRWIGTAKELLNLLTAQEYSQITGDEHHERTTVHAPREWYHTPARLGVELSRISFLLSRLDIRYHTEKGGKGVRTIILERISKYPATSATQTKLSSEEIGGRTENSSATHLPPATQKVAGEAGDGSTENSSCHPPPSTEKTPQVAGEAEDFDILSVCEEKVEDD